MSCPRCMSASVLHVCVYAPSQCLRYISMFMLRVQEYAAFPCPSCTSSLQVSVSAACPRLFCMSMSLLHVHVHFYISVSACPCPCLHVHVRACMSMSMLHIHVHAACPCPCFLSMPMLHVHVYAAYPCKMLYVHVLTASIARDKEVTSNMCY
jgi:hypothetical protein